jgi:hypothetical protein
MGDDAPKLHYTVALLCVPHTRDGFDNRTLLSIFHRHYHPQTVNVPIAVGSLAHPILSSGRIIEIYGWVWAGLSTKNSLEPPSSLSESSGPLFQRSIFEKDAWAVCFWADEKRDNNMGDAALYVGLTRETKPAEFGRPKRSKTNKEKQNGCTRRRMGELERHSQPTWYTASKPASTWSSLSGTTGWADGHSTSYTGGQAGLVLRRPCLVALLSFGESRYLL